MAFVEADVSLAGGPLLLRCSHLKFLPMGRVFEYAGRPWARPLTSALFEHFVAPLPLHETAVGVTDVRDHIFALSSSSNSRDEDEHAQQTLVVEPRHCNPIGGLHGGAACMLAELAAEQLAGRPVHALRVDLMTSIKATKTAQISARMLGADGASAKVVILDQRAIRAFCLCGEARYALHSRFWEERHTTLSVAARARAKTALSDVKKKLPHAGAVRPPSTRTATLRASPASAEF